MSTRRRRPRRLAMIPSIRVGVPSGRINHGRLTPLRPADGSDVFDEAW